MSTTLVPLQEYLDTSYSPDREYVNGVLVERHVGQFPHSWIQPNLAHFFLQRYPDLWVLTEQRLRTGPSCIRIPDVCVFLERPAKGIPDTPPFLCIEVLSPEDRMLEVLAKLKEYSTFGVPHNWVVDPFNKTAYIYPGGHLVEVEDSLVAGEISIPLSEVFDRL